MTEKVKIMTKANDRKHWLKIGKLSICQEPYPLLDIIMFLHPTSPLLVNHLQVVEAATV